VGDLASVKRGWFAPPERPRGRVLDLPAGSGTDSRNLHELGYQVVPADLFPEVFEVEGSGLRCVDADMAARLPFEDASFDYLLNSEGIEHLADQMSFLAECRRVLKPGGRLIITTPNLLSLRARVAFALTGNRGFRSFVDEVTSVWGYDGERLYHGHAFLINYFQLRYMLWHNGFRICDIVPTQHSPSSLALLPLVPAVRLFTRRAAGKARRRNPNPEIYSEIEQHVFSWELLLGKILCVVAERRAESQPVVTARAWRNARRQREDDRPAAAGVAAAGPPTRAR
jgi:SAM-dependent methyltransferase